MKRFLSMAVFIFFATGLLIAQEVTPAVQDSSLREDLRFTPFTLQNALFDKSFSDFELSALDSMPAPRPRRLLPENMSFMEKGLWGENGFLRSSGIASPLTPESRASELSLRRGMLVAHQIGGFVTLGFMVSAVYAGQKIIDGNSGYRPYHQAFVAGTIASYSITGLLAVLSPPPVIRRDEVSTTTIHKALAWVHFAGMVVTPILGSMIHRRSTVQQERFHQVSGYITTAALTAALITVTF